MIESKQVGGSTLAGVKPIVPWVDVFPWDTGIWPDNKPQPLDRERLQRQVEGMLQDAGIEVGYGSAPENDANAGQLHVLINMDSLILGTSDQIELRVYAVLVQVTLQETMCLCRNPNIRRLTTAWSNSTEPSVQRLLPSTVVEKEVSRILDKELARFVKEYRAANPQTHAECAR